MVAGGYTSFIEALSMPSDPFRMHKQFRVGSVEDITALAVSCGAKSEMARMWIYRAIEDHVLLRAKRGVYMNLNAGVDICELAPVISESAIVSLSTALGHAGVVHRTNTCRLVVPDREANIIRNKRVELPDNQGIIFIHSLSDAAYAIAKSHAVEVNTRFGECSYLESTPESALALQLYINFRTSRTAKVGVGDMELDLEDFDRDKFLGIASSLGVRKHALPILGLESMHDKEEKSEVGVRF